MPVEGIYGKLRYKVCLKFLLLYGGEVQVGKSKVTIKEIADMAGVSIATVSHVINRTRYVSPVLVEKIEQIIRDTGYIDKLAEKERKLKVGKNSIVVGIFPNMISAIYRDMASSLQRLMSEQGYQFWILLTNDDPREEQQLMDGLLSNKRIAGILHVPLTDEKSNYKKIIESDIPVVYMERSILGTDIDCVTFEDRKAVFTGTSYLIESGHKNLLFLRDEVESTTREERTKGYLEAMELINRHSSDANIVDINLQWDENKCQQMIQRALRRTMPTAVISSGNRLTLQLLKTIRNIGAQCPEELSVIGFCDKTWAEVVEPPLTTLERDVNSLCVLASNMLFEKIRTGKVSSQERTAKVDLKVRKSTRMLDNGPSGEEAVSPDSIVLTPEEKRRLRNGKFRVAISFHYTGTAWAELHEAGIRAAMEQYGIEIISVMDAHFDSCLQNMQLEGIHIQRPDAVIAIPTNDKDTASKFQELSKVTKLIFISNVPENLEKNSYVTCVSVNEWENGTNAGRLLGEYYKGKKHVKVGMINHDATFYGTRIRDAAAEKILTDNYPNIEILSSKGFGKIENTYQVCKDMLEMHKDLQALYVSWDQPALQAIRALKDIGREDVAIFTTDLDWEIAQHMKNGMVKGLSTQRPYEQGVALALVTAKALVSEEAIPKYVGVRPYVVEPHQLNRAWKDIFHVPMKN